MRLGFAIDNWRRWGGSEQTWHLALFMLIFHPLQMSEFTAVPICSLSVRKMKEKTEITKNIL